MVIFLCFLICLRFSLCCSDQQYYDRAPCFSNTNNPGTRYTCTSSSSSSTTPCRTFFVYRANNHLSTISNISKLFSIDSETLISINKHVNPTQVLETGHEVLLPILCSCPDGYYRSSFSYTVTENATLSAIACGIFQGLVKPITLAEENVLAGNADVGAGLVLRVPLKCACPDHDDGGAKYLITYPFIEGDDTRKVSLKFNVSLGEVLRVNHLEDPTPTVFPNTTVLVPLRDEPSINFTISGADPPTQFLPTKPVVRKGRLKNEVYIAAGSVVVVSLILAFLISCGLYLKGSKAEPERKEKKSCSTPISSPAFSTTPPCLSPDFLVGIKYSLCNYTLEELKQATRNFGEDSRISSSVYKGVVERGEVMIKEMRCGGTKQVIDVHSRINHVNILKLHGVCYSEEEDSSYVVMEYPRNGSLRECLSGGSLGWLRRTQIALDIATGLHYLHYSVIPSYTHLSLSSKNVFLNSKWRAKISVLGESGSAWLAPEHVADGGVGNEKVDIFAFGVVLTELISGKEAGDGRGVRESLRFLGTNNGGGGGGGGGCFDELRRFVDPGLKDDYPLAEALCLCVLAGSCLQHHPLHRPSIDHLLQILSTML